MKKILLPITTFFVILFISCAPSYVNHYTPFIDIDLLGTIEIGDSNYEVIKTLGEPLIIVKDYPDKQIWKYEYRYRTKVAHSVDELKYKKSGGLKTTEQYMFSEENNHNVFIHFKDNKVTQISVDNISRK